MVNFNLLAFIVPKIPTFIRTDRQTDWDRSNRLLILINNIYTLYGRKRYILPVTYLQRIWYTHLPLRVTGRNIHKPTKMFLTEQNI